MTSTVAILSTLDTKGVETAYFKDRIEELGCATLIIDVGVFEPVGITPDVSRDEVASAAHSSMAEIIRGGEKSIAFRTMSKGATRKIIQLYKEQRFDAVVSVGGGTGTHVVAGAMQTLPIGMPKLMVTTVASRDVSDIIGSKDIVLMNAVCDIIGLNFMTRKLLATAAGAIVGMTNVMQAPRADRKVIGLTSFSPLNQCAFSTREMLRHLGYEVIPFHAVGSGSMAMETLIDEGMIHGVLDLSLHEFVDQLHGGYCKNIGADRLEAAGRAGIPHVILPGGIDMIVFECTSLEGIPPHLRHRSFVSHDFRSLLRSNADDYNQIAVIIAEKVNRAKRPPTVVIPLKGWSTVDAPRGKFYDPELDRIFISKLRSLLNSYVRVVEVDSNINDEGCAKVAVNELHRQLERDLGETADTQDFEGVE